MTGDGTTTPPVAADSQNTDLAGNGPLPARPYEPPRTSDRGLGATKTPRLSPRRIGAHPDTLPAPIEVLADDGSSAFFYQHAELRSEIEALRTAQATAPAHLPVGQRASDASLRARLRAALDEGQRQREELARLRDELALVHGRVRELELDRRLRRT